MVGPSGRTFLHSQAEEGSIQSDSGDDSEDSGDDSEGDDWMYKKQIISKPCWRFFLPKQLLLSLQEAPFSRRRPIYIFSIITTIEGSDNSYFCYFRIRHSSKIWSSSYLLKLIKLQALVYSKIVDE